MAVPSSPPCLHALSVVTMQPLCIPVHMNQWKVQLYVSNLSVSYMMKYDGSAKGSRQTQSSRVVGVDLTLTTEHNVRVGQTVHHHNPREGVNIHEEM